MKTITTSTIIAVNNTDAIKCIGDRIYVFDSVLFGQKRPGDIIKTMNKNFRVYGVVNKDTAEFGEGGNDTVKYYMPCDNIWQRKNWWDYDHPFFLTDRKSVIRYVIDACLQYQGRMEGCDLLPF